METRVFTANKIFGHSRVVNEIVNYVKGKLVIDIVEDETAFNTHYTVVVDELNVKKVGKGWGKSKYRGVYWDKRSKKWRAQISFNKKTHHYRSI